MIFHHLFILRVTARTILCILLTTLPCTIGAEKSSHPTPSTKAAQTRVEFTNGNQLHCSQLTLDQKKLWMNTNHLSQPTAFKLDLIRSIQLPYKEAAPSPGSHAVIRFHPRFRETHGDVLYGSIQSVTTDEVIITTTYTGTIKAKRNTIQSIQFFLSEKGHYFGPKRRGEWTSLPSNNWKFYQGTLISQTNGNVGYDVKLSEKSHLSFDLKCQTSMHFHILLYTSSVTDLRPDAYYDLTINRDYAALRTYGKSENSKDINPNQWQQIQPPINTHNYHFDIFTDRKTGVVTLFIDGIHAGELQSESPDPSDLGTGLSFVAYKRNPIKISNIVTKPWSGVTLPKLAKPKQKKTVSSQSLITLLSGKPIPFTTCHVENQNLIIINGDHSENVLLKEVETITLGSTGEEPKKYAGDVRACFHQGGSITFQPTSIKEGKISGTNQSLGAITLDLNAFSRIDFHIYNKKAHHP